MTQQSQQRTYHVAFISLGCPKNQVDCELMLSRTQGAGFVLTRHMSEADAIVINTCSFIAPAIAEADSQIREAWRYKEHGRCKALVVAGCLPQYLAQQREQQYPFVDAWLTPDNPSDVGEVLTQLLAADVCLQPASTPPIIGASHPALPRFLASAADGRVLSTPPSYAYVKIAEGCDHRCSFCIIPQLRGSYRSRPLPDIVAEVRHVLAQGIPEIILVSQDCSYYGMDSGGPGLIDLLASLCALPGEFWLRVLYLYPREFRAAELAAWAALGPKLLPYFDIPIQHVSPRILQDMSRGGSRLEIDYLFQRINQHCPCAVLRTSLITGFPGETEAEFSELLDWVKSGIAERVGVFAYSDLPEMRSHALAGQLPAAVVEQRRLKLVTAHTDTHAAQAAQLIDSVQPAVLESRSKLPNGSWHYIGRTWRDAPQIDGILSVTAREKMPLFKHCQVRINGVNGCDLSGVIHTR